MYTYKDMRVPTDDERAVILNQIKAALIEALQMSEELERLGYPELHLWNLQDWEIAFGLLAWLSPYGTPEVEDPFNGVTYEPCEIDPSVKQLRCLNRALHKLDHSGVKYAKGKCDGELDAKTIRKRMDVNRAKKAAADAIARNNHFNELFSKN